MPGLEKLRWKHGKLRAWKAFRRAERDVPAYKSFLNGTPVHRFEDVPEIDKENYVKAYDMYARCAGGKLKGGTIIDESSGSSGIPTNWARGRQERLHNKRMLLFALRRQIGPDNLFIINAFALGSWATGMNLSFAFESEAILKSLGPDIQKIKNTLALFGTQYHYLIMGYPPFLKMLVDEKDIEWKNYHISFVFGGEGITETMRAYIIGKGIREVIGSYGASDLELNIAAETRFTIALRRKMVENPSLAQALVEHTGTLPMIFQYDPADFFIETNREGELLITLCRPGYLSPKVRYNIHDLGHVMRMGELRPVLKKFGLSPEQLGAKTDMPLLFHYGRADMAVAFYGCKITPADMEEALMRIPEIGDNLNSFFLSIKEDASADKHLGIHVELAPHIEKLSMATAELREKVLENLRIINQDYRESSRMLNGNIPELKVYPYRTGPFENSDIRLKQKYIR
jgi:phenylacetate-CoA ligase